MPVLDHRLLRQFLAVAETGSVRAASRRLNMSQPPITAALRQLEDRLGTPLFERSVRGMTPTPAGRALAEEARSVLARLERAEARISAIGGRPQALTIGFVSAALNGALPALLRGLGPEPLPRLAEMTTPEQLDALAEGRIDVGLLHPPIPRLPDIDGASLGRDPFWAALPSNHSLARRKRLRFADIAGEPLVLYPEAQGPVLYDRIRAMAIEASGTFRVAAEARRIHSQLAIVAGGLGVGLVTRSTARVLRFGGVTAVPLSDTADRLFLELELVTEADRLPSLVRLIAANMKAAP